MTGFVLAMMFGVLAEPGANQEQTVEYRGKTYFATLSPDKSRVVFDAPINGNREILIADADGKNIKQLTDNQCLDYQASWKPDGKRIVFCSKRMGGYQIFEMAPDGSDVILISKAKHGARNPAYSRAGILAYQIMYPRQGKVENSDVVLTTPDGLKRIFHNEFVTDFEWSPNGNKIAIGTVNKIVFYDVATEQSKTVDVYQHDERLYSHGPHRLRWDDANSRVGCTINFLGGRTAGTVIYGDDQVFEVTIDGAIKAYEPEDLKKVSEPWLKRAAHRRLR